MKKIIYGITGLLLLATMGGGSYFWYTKNMQPKIYKSDEFKCDESTYYDFAAEKEGFCASKDFHKTFACLVTMGKCYDLDGKPITGTIQVFEENHLVAERHYIKGVENGYRTEYYPDGSILMRDTYQDGVKHGDSKGYMPSGTISYHNTYVNGKLESLLIFYENGDVYDKGIFDENMTGLVTTYYPNKTIAKETPFVRGKGNGLYKNYFETGKLKAEGFLKDGNPHGIFYQYDETGYLKSEEQRVNGTLEGPFITFYPTGKVAMELFYKNDLKHGKAKYYWTGGQLMIEKTYENDVEQGPVKTFYPDGQPEIVGSYLNGKWHGQKTTYYPNGNKALIEQYKNGDLVDKATAYHPNGKVRLEVVLNETTGFEKSLKSYNDKGRLTAEIILNGEELDPKTRLYNPKTKKYDYAPKTDNPTFNEQLRQTINAVSDEEKQLLSLGTSFLDNP